LFIVCYCAVYKELAITKVTDVDSFSKSSLCHSLARARINAYARTHTQYVYIDPTYTENM